jgi:uncharacterized damage-inducible protein DinB
MPGGRQRPGRPAACTRILVPYLRGLRVVTGQWDSSFPEKPLSKAEILKRWDESTKKIDEVWPRIPADRFHERLTAFGQNEGVVHDLVFYIIDNEIHHRGQGYVYLRALGVEPPPFNDRP